MLNYIRNLIGFSEISYSHTISDRTQYEKFSVFKSSIASTFILIKMLFPQILSIQK